jgi:cobalamin-dependent methionine synthase I
MFSKPFVIGDRLTTSNHSVKLAVEARDMASLSHIADVQLANGADALDLSACSSGERELDHLVTLHACIPVERSDTVFSIDTQDPAVIAGLRRRLRCAPILNCYSGLLDSAEEMQASLAAAAPIAGVVAVCVDFRGTNISAACRMDIAIRMADELAEAGLRTEQIVFDPVTMPSSVGSKAEQVTLDTIEMLRARFPKSGILCATSNYSYGLHKHRDAEHAFARRAKANGASVFLLNALDRELCEIARGRE